ncbi:A/G-specific adenine glycosylase [Candidatus Peregrinibacteria bacterium]|nr:MAG: A/G-specific adenine glycosylase [Candidatus Peregrinibacteria bacterium]
MFQDDLLSWFKTEQRKLPWRLHYEPYQVWISEIMLQQTQVATVLPYFDRWMKVFPNLEALAAAPEEQVLKLWEGLGYYSRARNLQKAARQIVEKHGGVFPSNFEVVLSLPGIGPYTAGAICSIAFNQNQAAVDGNVVRVLSRLENFKGDVKKNMNFFWTRAAELLPPGQARDFNQGLMELGALICAPKNPKCSSCPVQAHCKAFEAGTVVSLPNKGPGPSKVKIQVAIAILEKEGKVFVQKRHEKGLMGGLWEFPGGKVEPGESIEEALRREVLEETGLSLGPLRFLMNLQHAYTRYQVDLHCYLAEPLGDQVRLTAASEWRFVPPQELKDMAFPAANVKLIERYLGLGPLNS